MHPTLIPLRVTTGAFILDAGIGKLSADEGTAKWLHNSAATAYPFLADIKPKDFARLLAIGEIVVGGALLTPFVPSKTAGALLTGFGAGLVGLYLRTPGMTKEDGIRPTPDGLSTAKDSWLLGAGLTLMSQGAVSDAKAGVKKVRRRARKLKS
ncbi:hypothetical protein BJY21_001705 [Kineosphaera limosa]|uniref:DoxX family protein n=1 Tax=Kineosphaera limosa NBRC 100340 TaxID=1184609 RepID=K6VFP2_9MICO|nr:hypothetical protein [Kineosphaera limosa]NYE00521.1 hypothetical protein [Kineosphaera limosa]GAB95013.1 hypothetical protein KILIM_015_00740 [Kineosphaera limosa NBRC 100340]